MSNIPKIFFNCNEDGKPYIDQNSLNYTVNTTIDILQDTKLRLVSLEFEVARLNEVIYKLLGKLEEMSEYQSVKYKDLWM